ncbi:right-handed parallel beta-helix repeat-containing protein [Catenovulum sp. 2E275]|uniref:right-handed parallel beta-helix repeat-containing protein n=1 Tax=Catenovulum sp. 2E275 TaxID=2980497 RepID=UPI0021CFFF60|nr:right-handed parallel beta-helix repeat-containing protein [Catenovulum sp. 2E275]MCU4674816.1 right-handed parallel beta-helix repeat-containing protein [Catenovulum sp. 2E275]
MLFLSSFFFCASACAELNLKTCTKLVNAHVENGVTSSNLGGNNIPVYETVEQAIGVYQANDVICLTNQQQASFEIKNFTPGVGKLTIQPVTGEHVVNIENSDYRGAGVLIESSKNIELVGFSIHGGLYGVRVVDSSDIRLANLHVYNVGQEALSVRPKHAGGSNYIIEDNYIEQTGKKNAQYGEAIYVGDGSLKATVPVSNIMVRNNTITHTTAEAIDIKTNAQQVRIENNIIRDINLKFNGAITVGIEDNFLIGGDYQVINNDISGVTNRSGYRPLGISVGHGNTQIFDNKINIFDKKAIGVCLVTTFVNDYFKTVWLRANQYTGEGIALSKRCGSAGTGVNKPAEVIEMDETPAS